MIVKKIAEILIDEEIYNIINRPEGDIQEYTMIGCVEDLREHIKEIDKLPHQYAKLTIDEINQGISLIKTGEIDDIVFVLQD